MYLKFCTYISVYFVTLCHNFQTCLDKVVTFVQIFLWQPLKELLSTSLRKRDGHKRLFLYLSFCIYCLYGVAYSHKGEIYNYLSKVRANMYKMIIDLQNVGLCHS